MGEHIPKFESREEEARFWQRTGLEQVSPDEWDEVKVERPERPLSATFAVRFDPKTIDLLRRVAKAQGVGATQLVRVWVLDRIRLERVAGLLTTPTTDFPTDFELTLRKKVLDSLLENLPAAVERAMQEVLDRADIESRALTGSD